MVDDVQEEAVGVNLWQWVCLRCFWSVEERASVEKKQGWSFFPLDEEREAYKQAIEEEMGEEVPYIDMTNPSLPSEGPLPELTREQVCVCLNDLMETDSSVGLAVVSLREWRHLCHVSVS